MCDQKKLNYFLIMKIVAIIFRNVIYCTTLAVGQYWWRDCLLFFDYPGYWKGNIFYYSWWLWSLKWCIGIVFEGFFSKYMIIDEDDCHVGNFNNGMGFWIIFGRPPEWFSELTRINNLEIGGDPIINLRPKFYP